MFWVVVILNFIIQQEKIVWSPNDCWCFNSQLGVDLCILVECFVSVVLSQMRLSEGNWHVHTHTHTHSQVWQTFPLNTWSPLRAWLHVYTVRCHSDVWCYTNTHCPL